MAEGIDWDRTIMTIKIWGLIGAGGLLLFSGLANPQAAKSHGKEVTIEVWATTPDSQNPRVRLYRAFVVYADDKEAVTDAVIYLQGQRRQSGEITERVRLQPLNNPGFYVAQVIFPRHGTWDLKLEAEGANEGAISIVEEILPAALSREGLTEEAGDQRSIFTVSLSFSQRDIANLAMRWVHSLAAAAWFGLSGLIVAILLLGKGEEIGRFLEKLRPFFPLSAALSLALLAGTGVYNAVYNSPVKPPGVFSWDVMGRIPYGTPYLATVGLKTLAIAIGAVLAVGMAKELKRAASPPPGNNPGPRQGQKRPRLLALAATNLALGLAMLLAVAVMAYLHNLSHLAVLVPRG